MEPPPKPSCHLRGEEYRTERHRSTWSVHPVRDERVTCVVSRATRFRRTDCCCLFSRVHTGRKSLSYLVHVNNFSNNGSVRFILP